MPRLTKQDLVKFQKAIMEDYGLGLEGDELYRAAYTLLQFIKALTKFDKYDKDEKNSKKVLKSSK